MSLLSVLCSFFSAYGAFSTSFKPASAATTPPVWESVGSISTDTNATGATASVSGTPATNDILLAHVTITNSSTSTITAPSGEGWTLVARGDDTAGSDCTCAVYWKRWGTGSTDNTSIAFTGTAGNMRLVISRVSGVNVTTAFGAGEKASANGAGTGTDIKATAPSVTSDGADRLVMRFYSGSAGTMNFSSIAATGRYSGGSYAFTAGVDGACAGGTATAGAGSTGTTDATASATLANGWAAVTVALDPA